MPEKLNYVLTQKSQIVTTKVNSFRKIVTSKPHIFRGEQLK